MVLCVCFIPGTWSYYASGPLIQYYYKVRTYIHTRITRVFGTCLGNNKALSIQKQFSLKYILDLNVYNNVDVLRLAKYATMHLFWIYKIFAYVPIRTRGQGNLY